MDIPELLRHAARAVPTAAVTDAGLSVLDADEYLDHDEWEIALDILTELGDAHSTTVERGDVLIDAAERMWPTNTTAWCCWRRREASHGTIRAELRLLDTGRRHPIPGRVTRPFNEPPAPLSSR